MSTDSLAHASTIALRDIHGLVGVHRERVDRAALLDGELGALDRNVDLLTLTDAALVTLLATASAESLKAIEQTITYGLRTVFDDRSLAFRFDVSQTRGAQSVEPLLISADGMEAPVLDAFGGGPATVVAFLLRLIVCHRTQLYPLILLDETFSMVSAQYVPNLAKLLRELAGQLGYTFVLVTHQPSFLDHADKAYEVVSASSGTTFKEVS